LAEENDLSCPDFDDVRLDRVPAAPLSIAVQQTAADQSSLMKFEDASSAAPGINPGKPPATGREWALIIGIADCAGTGSDL